MRGSVFYDEHFECSCRNRRDLAFVEHIFIALRAPQIVAYVEIPVAVCFAYNNVGNRESAASVGIFEIYSESEAGAVGTSVDIGSIETALYNGGGGINFVVVFIVIKLPRRIRYFVIAEVQNKVGLAHIDVGNERIGNIEVCNRVGRDFAIGLCKNKAVGL